MYLPHGYNTEHIYVIALAIIHKYVIIAARYSQQVKCKVSLGLPAQYIVSSNLTSTL